MNALTEDVHTYLTTSPGSSFLNQAVSMQAAWEGTSNLLWRVESGGQEAVVKYYGDAGQARGRRQLDGQERFYPFGLAPRPLWFDRYPTGISRQVLVYEWQPGTELVAPDAGQLMRFAQVVAQVHSGDPTEVRRFSPNPVNLEYLWNVLHGGIPTLQAWLHERSATSLAHCVQKLVANAQALIDAALPLWQGVAPTPIHGDLKLENTLNSLGTVVLLDWEMFGLGDAAFDVATFLHMSQAELDTEQQALWLDSYLSLFAQPNLAQRIGVYRRILPLQNLTYLLHGLRQSNPTEATAIHENQDFFQATVTAALGQAAAALQVEPTVAEEEISRVIGL